MIQTVVRQTLRIHTRHIWRKTPRRNSLGIRQSDHPINRDPASDRRPVKGLQQRFRQCQSRSFDQNVIRQRVQRHQGFDRRNKVIGYSAANTTVRQFYDVFRRAIRDGAAFQNLTIHTHITKLIDDHRQTAAFGRFDQMADQSGFPRPQKARHNRHRNFRKITHSGASNGARGGMRAIQFFRKCSGLSRQGTSPSDVAR